MDSELTDAQVIEFLHLAFLQVLQSRVGQDNYVLKGGTNLRYFYEGVRYSEDIDLDAVSIEPWKLEAKIDDVLSSPATAILIRSQGLTMAHVTKPKQTETTQRWKLSIQVGDHREPIRTRIGFSHPSADPRRLLEAVPDRVVAPYAVRAPTMQHYSADAAIEQKIIALAKRSETQARDVFDLELLLRQHRGGMSLSIDPHIIDLATQRISELPFGAFQTQVLPFLDMEVAELYDRDGWGRMQTFVAEQLRALR